MTTVFRFIYWTESYEETIHFYRDLLERPIVKEWDRGINERGTIFNAGGGEIEVLAISPGKVVVQPDGFEVAIEVEDVDDLYQYVKEKKVSIRGEIADKPWGQRTFSVNDPNGIKLIFFAEI